MKGKKKEIICSVVLIFLVAGFIAGGIFFLRKSAEHEISEQAKTENKIQSQDNKTEDNNVDGLQNGSEEPEEATEEEAAEEPEESTPSIEGDLPSAWDYVEEDNTPVVLSEKQLLDGKIPEEKLAVLETELLSFLEENQEYRREITVEKFSLKDTDNEVSFYGKFQNPRTDRKKIFVIYDKASQSYQFSLQKEE